MMKKSVLLTAVVCLQWLNVTNAILNRARMPLVLRSANDSGLVGNHEDGGTLEMLGMDGVFVLVPKPRNSSSEINPGEFRQKNINEVVRLDGNNLNNRKFDYGIGKNGRFVMKKAKWHNDPEMSRRVYSQSGRGSAIQYTEEMLSQQFVGRMKPKHETLRKARTLTSEENEDASFQEDGFQDHIKIKNKRKHEAMLKNSKRANARIETRSKRKSSCTGQGRCENLQKVIPKNSHREDHVNETTVADGVIIFQDGEQTNKFRLSVEASHLLRCQKGQPPQINLPINSQLSLDTRGANLDHNTECQWRLKVVDGRGLMVHCYLQRDKGGLFDTSSALTLVPGADINGLVKIERLNRRVPQGVWYFRSKEIRIIFNAGRRWAVGSTFYKCDVLVK